MTSKVRDIDHGWHRIKQELKKADNAKVRIGVLQTAGYYNTEDGDSISIAEVAFFNEYGTSRGTPERPFIRTTADERRNQYAKALKSEMSKVFAGKSTVRISLEKIGTAARGHVKKKIRDIKTPPNSPITIALKGSSNPLIADGVLLRSIDYEVKGAGW